MNNEATKFRGKINVTVQPDGKGYAAQCLEMDVFTEGDTQKELIDNLIEAVNLHLEDESKYIDISNLALSMDMSYFFNKYSYLNTAALADYINMNKQLLSQYINGHKNPSLKQVHRIEKGVQDIGRELSSVQFD